VLLAEGGLTVADVPHLALPFRVVNGAAVTLEQDSDADVRQCVRTILAYPLGHREDAPEFGTRDQAHRQGGADLAELADAVERWEDRAHVAAGRDGLVDYVDRVRIELGRGAAAS
jgi:phage baseplate assembly protein W